MKLAIPVVYNDKFITGYEVKQPTMGVLANIKKIVENGRYYKAVSELVSKCIEYFETDDGTMVEDDFARICKSLHYQTLEEISIRIFAKITDDKFEGIYQCPRCGYKVITEMVDEETDERDSINDMTVNYCDGEADNIYLELKNPIKIKLRSTQEGEAVTEIKTIEMRHPTIEDCISTAVRKTRDAIEEQINIYVRCLININGEPIDNIWKSNMGKVLFDKFSYADMLKLNREIYKYGLVKTLKKECPECGKVWDADINTTNFFVSALQSI